MMKKFILKLSLVGILVFGVLLAGEMYVRQIPNPCSYKHNYIQTHGDSIEVLVMGQSHAYTGIDPDYFEKNTFNLAYGARILEYDRLLLEQYVDKCPNLSHIILPISYASLYDEPFEETDMWWYIINYQVYMNTHSHSFFSKYNFEFSHREVFIGKIKKALSGAKPLECKKNGMGLDNRLADRPSNWEELYEDAIEHHTANSDKYLAYNLEQLSRIIDICEQHQIELDIVTTPVWHTYFEHLNTKQLNVTIDTLTYLSRNHQFVRYFNYIQDDRFIDEDFSEVQHLSEYGAVKFTRILQNDIFDDKQ